jgi:hypothetical protein
LTANKRHRFKHTTTLAERLEQEAERLREQAQILPLGPERTLIRHKLRQAETALRIDRWLSCPNSTEAAGRGSAERDRE